MVAAAGRATSHHRGPPRGHEGLRDLALHSAHQEGERHRRLGLPQRVPLHRGDDGAQGVVLRPAAGAGLDVPERLLELAPLESSRGEEAHAAAPAQVLRTCKEASEDHGWLPARVARIRESARCRLLFTVPRLMSSARAISSRLMSW